MKIPKETCPECEQDIVITEENKFARHRFPASTVPGTRIRRLGDWCEGSGQKPVDE